MLALEARAKVNLGLAVLGRRPDGFHEIDTLMARLELADRLTLEPRPQGIALTVTGAELPAGRGNLAYRAAEAYLAAAGWPGGVALRLKKRVPVAAGLGGGSSDAAAVLRGLARLYPAPVDLLALAAGLGSDVPFFVLDVSAARATGRGEGLEPCALPPLALVLVNPGVAVSAADAYAWLERGRMGRNALEPGVVRRHPVVGEALAALRAAGLRDVLMSGSGATCFGVAANEGEARAVARALAKRQPGWWVRPTRTG